ncbi:MAG TPA: hypothetical protein DDZ51_05940 [Planctomycetaceae bacterium]|nr:hypothetical protein [Planctomycetaceae bacterium]
MAASTSFPKSDERVLRVLTDLSGSSGQHEYDEYLTCFPLSEGRQCAIGKTWLATEMDRPGCVWTHVLIFDAAALRSIKSLESLLQAFVRPRADSFSQFKFSLTISTGEESNAALPDGIKRLDVSLAETVYSSECPVFVISESPSDHTACVLNLWLNHLKLSAYMLSFCTGSIRPRRYGLTPLDVQLIPRNAVRDVMQQLPDANVIDTRGLAGGVASWARIVADKDHRHHRSLESFVVAHRTSSSRREVGDLARLFAMLTTEEYGHDRVMSVASEIATTWPDCTEMTALKESVFGPIEQRSFFRNVDDLKLVEAIVRPHISSSFDWAALCVSQRLQAAWTHDRDSAKNTLLTMVTPVEPTASKTVVSVLVAALRDSDIAVLKAFPDAIVLGVLSQRDDLFMASTTWESIEASLLFAVISKRRVREREFVEGVVTSILASGRDVAVNDAVAIFGPDIVTPILTWGTQQGFNSLSHHWISTLSHFPDRVAQWACDGKQLDANIFASVVSQLDLDSDAIRRCEISVWLEFAKNARYVTDSIGRMNLTAFLLSVAFIIDDEEAAELLSFTFCDYYAGIKSHIIPNSAANRLDRYLPNGFLWDDSKRLYVGLVKRFVECDWPIAQFLRAIDDPTLADAIYGTWGWANKEKQFLGNVLDFTLNSSPDASSELKRVLEGYEKWF